MESRKRKRGPCKDQKENEKLPIRKIAKREKCVPILPDEIWTMISAIWTQLPFIPKSP